MSVQVTYEQGGFDATIDEPLDFANITSLPNGEPDYLKLMGRKPTKLIQTEEGYNHVTNREIFKLFAVKPRMIDAGPADTTFNLFGKMFTTPILSSGLSGLGMEGMRAVAQGIKEAGSLMALGISSMKMLEEIISVGAPTIKFVKPFRDFNMLADKVKHAEDAGAIAVGCDIIYGFGSKFGEREFMKDGFAPLSQAQLKKLVDSVSIPFIVKGVLSEEDAVKAKEAGAKGIVVSNHGGAIVDYCIHPLEVLSDIRQAVGKEMVIFVDSGFQRGTDVFKALALGGDAVLLGTALLNPLNVAGSDGVRDIVNIMTGELKRVMSVTGYKALNEIDGKAIMKRGYAFPDK